jgi:hypothetical protein
MAINSEIFQIFFWDFTINRDLLWDFHGIVLTGIFSGDSWGLKQPVFADING